jgi:hypothetical protein
LRSPLHGIPILLKVSHRLQLPAYFRVRGLLSQNGCWCPH